MIDDDFEITRKYFPEEEKFQLIRKKGCYMYEYMDSIKKFEETELPTKEAFFSKLKQENISDKEYSHAKKVWDVFNCKTIKDYHMLYLKSDVLLLVDCWRNFKKVIYEQYQIDPSYSYTTAGFNMVLWIKIYKDKIRNFTKY